MSKLLAHCVARVGRREALLEALAAAARDWAEQRGLRTALFEARSKDPLRCSGEGQPLPRAFDASLEAVAAEDGDDVEALVAAAGDLGARLTGLVHADLCAALVGRDRVFVECPPTEVRYQYCMRRRPDWSHADYLVRYAEGHSPIGVRTQGKRGYRQLHVDLDTSARAGEAAGFGVRAVDSVAQLELESLETFLAAGRENAQLGAAEDEEQFVDRAASVMWVSDVIARCQPRQSPR